MYFTLVCVWFAWWDVTTSRAISATQSKVSHSRHLVGALISCWQGTKHCFKKTLFSACFASLSGNLRLCCFYLRVLGWTSLEDVCLFVCFWVGQLSCLNRKIFDWRPLPEAAAVRLGRDRKRLCFMPGMMPSESVRSWSFTAAAGSHETWNI